MTPDCSFITRLQTVLHQGHFGEFQCLPSVLFLTLSLLLTPALIFFKKRKRKKALLHVTLFYQSAAVPHTHAGRGAEHVYTCAESSLSSASPANPVSRAGAPRSREKALSKQREGRGRWGSCEVLGHLFWRKRAKSGPGGSTANLL